MPGIYWTESEFDGQWSTCGPNSLAMALCWAEQRYIGDAVAGRTATEVIYHRMVAARRCDPSGASTGEGLEEQANADGYRTWRHGFQNPIPEDQWVAVLKQRLGEPAAVVMELARGGRLGNTLSPHGEDATPDLAFHYICICKYHPGGWSSIAGQDLPEGFWVADGDSDANNPIVNGARTRVRSGTTLQFYSIPTLVAAQPCELLAVYPKGVLGMAGWTDDGTTLVAPNGIPVVHGFRAWIRAHDWDADDLPLEAEHVDGHGGSTQLFSKSLLTWEPESGVRRAAVGHEWQAAEQQLASAEQQLATVAQELASTEQQVAARDQTIASLNAQIADLRSKLAQGGTPTAPGVNQDDSVVEDHPLTPELLKMGPKKDEMAINGPPQTKLKITQKQMPETFITADRKSLSAQRMYRWTVGGEQWLLVLAAFAGFLPALFGLALLAGLIGGLGAQLTSDAQIVVTLALAGTVAIRVYRNSNHPDADWFDARMLAEEVMSQSWRYAMGASPYEPSADAEAAEGISSAMELRFMEQIEQLRQGSSVNLDTFSAKQGIKQLPDDLKALRDSDLREKVQVYRRDRLEDQAKWYRRKALLYQRKARNWNRAILGIEALAFLAAVATSFGLHSLDLYGLAGTIIAGAGVWLQMQQYATLGRRYSAMARNLETYVDVLRVTGEITPETWAKIVDHVEGLMEREHQGWLTLYQHLRLPGTEAKAATVGLPELPTLSQVRQTVGAVPRK